MGSDDYKAMSREEQLQQTAEEWADYYKHAEDLCDYISIRVAYKEGAAWADKHPDISALWHPASEEPIVNSTQIVYQDKSGLCWFASNQERYAYDWDWARMAAAFQMTRWAYITDLLPKGGEE